MSQQSTMKINNDEERVVPERVVPIGAVMARLATNTAERNASAMGLHYANIKIRESKDGHIATLGRLVKYEGVPIIDEVLEYAKSAGIFIGCESKHIGVMTKIIPYTNKKGKTAPAHYTIYDKFLEMVKVGDEQPKSYRGFFLYKTYAEQFDKYLDKSVQSFIKIDDLFDFP